MFATQVLAIVLAIFAVSANGEISAKSTSTQDQRQKLWNSLMEDYNPTINPDTDVKFGVALLDVDLVESKNVMETNVWLRIVWNDTRLSWDTAKYGDSVLRVDSKAIWTPDITLYNAANWAEYDAACKDVNALIYSNGEVLWVSPCKFKSYCNLHHLQVDRYHEQTCTMKFGSWTFDGLMQDLQLYNNETKADLSDLFDVTDWKIVNNVAARTEKKYDCCAEPYVDLTFNLTMRRKTEAEKLSAIEL